MHVGPSKRVALSWQILSKRKLAFEGFSGYEAKRPGSPCTSHWPLKNQIHSSISDWRLYVVERRQKHGCRIRRSTVFRTLKRSSKRRFGTCLLRTSHFATTSRKLNHVVPLSFTTLCTPNILSFLPQYPSALSILAVSISFANAAMHRPGTTHAWHEARADMALDLLYVGWTSNQHVLDGHSPLTASTNA